MVSPQKSRGQVEKEAAEGKDLYKKSHSNYDVGGWIDTVNQERVSALHSLYPILVRLPSLSLPIPGEMTDRNYDWSTFTKASLYGVPTPHDNSGIGVRNAMHWLHIARRCVQQTAANCFALTCIK